MENEKRSCARGRVTIYHVVRGHYELRINQTRGFDAPSDASVCLTEDELRSLADMIGKMWGPDQNSLDFTATRLEPDGEEAEHSALSP